MTADNRLRILRVSRDDAETARGVVVVIDVLRAFSVAAYALAGGADRLWLVRSEEDAFALRRLRPEALLAGEVRGRLIPGFDLNNSPSLMAQSDVHGRLIIQRTGAGTQGAVASTHADHLLVCSLVNARSTAELSRMLAERHGLPITLIPTEPRRQGMEIEDEVCADYLEALLLRPNEASHVLTEGIERLVASDRFAAFSGGEADFPSGDIPATLDVDRFGFAMTGVHRLHGDIRYVEVQQNWQLPADVENRAHARDDGRVPVRRQPGHRD